MCLYILGGWSNVVCGALDAACGGFLAVWLVWWRLGVVWGVLGVLMDRYKNFEIDFVTEI